MGGRDREVMGGRERQGGNGWEGETGREVVWVCYTGRPGCYILSTQCVKSGFKLE